MFDINVQKLCLSFGMSYSMRIWQIRNFKYVGFTKIFVCHPMHGFIIARDIEGPMQNDFNKIKAVIE